MIPLLTPIFRGPWAVYGEGLQCAPTWPAQAIPVAELLRSEGLLPKILHKHARHLGVIDHDLRAAASAWSLSYLAALLPPMVAAASLLQHRLPAATQDMALSLDEHGEPKCFHIRDQGVAMPGSSVAERYDELLWLHLQPLFEVIQHRTRLAPKILWGNAARWLEAVLDQGAQLAAGAGLSAALAEDRTLLLDSRVWPHGRANPLYPRLRDVRSAGQALHRQCCLYYLLPDQGYCGACPLASTNVRHETAD